MIANVIGLAACVIVSGLIGAWLTQGERLLEAKRWCVDRALQLYYGRIDPLVDEIRRGRRRGDALPRREADDCVILVPRSAGPVVESRDTKYPVPLSHVPIRSSKADAKRAAHAYAEQRAGRPLTWKKARQLLNAWEREERALERPSTAEPSA